MSMWRLLLPVFPGAQGASFLMATLSSFQGVWKVSSCSGSSFYPCRGKLLQLSCVWRSCDLMDCSPPGFSVAWRFQARVGYHFLLQGIFPTQGSNLHLLHRQVDSTTEPPGKACGGKWQMPVCRWQNPEDSKRKSQQRWLKKNDHWRGRKPVGCGIRETKSGKFQEGGVEINMLLREQVK